MKTYTLWMLWLNKCSTAYFWSIILQRTAQTHSFSLSYLMWCTVFRLELANKVAMDYYDGAFQLEPNFSKHLPNTMVINAKLSPIIFNKGFKYIIAFWVCLRIHSKFALFLCENTSKRRFLSAIVRRHMRIQLLFVFPFQFSPDFLIEILNCDFSSWHSLSIFNIHLWISI